jgi:hypothetical protein
LLKEILGKLKKGTEKIWKKVKEFIKCIKDNVWTIIFGAGAVIIPCSPIGITIWQQILTFVVTIDWNVYLLI